MFFILMCKNERTFIKSLFESISIIFSTGESAVSRKRRSVKLSNVYVELLLYMSEGKSTKVVFACAEKPNYNLILASDACALLKNTEVQCLSDPYSSAERQQNKKTSKFPQWSIYVSVVGIILVLIVILMFIYQRRKANKVGFGYL